jgi:hypothetical protein
MFKVKFLLEEEHLKGVFISINDYNTSIYSKIILKYGKVQSLCKCSKYSNNKKKVVEWLNGITNEIEEKEWTENGDIYETNWLNIEKNLLLKN